MSPSTGGVGHQLTNIDSVLTVLGATHPSVSVQLLITLIFVIFGLGSLETSSLLPIPLYGCWGSLGLEDLSGRNVCLNVALLNTSPPNATYKIWACGSEAWWQPLTMGGVFLTVGRCIAILCAGVATDALGRRRSAIAWAGTYFVFSFVITFAPLAEVYAIGTTLHALFAQATTLAIILIATENSTQKESVRSGCLVLLGHSIGSGILVPIINTYLTDEIFRSLARLLPSVFFVALIFFLPESVRWVISKGSLEHVSSVLKHSHGTILEESAKPKVGIVYHEMRKSLAKYGSKGCTVRQAVSPLFLARPLHRIFFPAILISFLVGCAIGFRLRHDTLPYHSLEDRLVAFGVTEILALQVLGLVLARLPVRRVLVALCGLLSLAIVLTRTVRIVGLSSCVIEVFLSCGGHFLAVLTWVWLILGLIRVTPTHSRGTVVGLAISFATLGHSYSYLIHTTVVDTLDWPEHFIAMLFAGFAILASITSLILPCTPDVMPDTIPHMAPHLHWPEYTARSNDEGANLENTRL